MQGCAFNKLNDCFPPATVIPRDNAIPIVSISGDWPVYKTAKEAADASTDIFTGKIVDISFDIIDTQTGETDVSYSPKNTTRMLYTVYTIEVNESYKGENDKTVKLYIMGGLIGFCEEEQYKLLQESGLLNTYRGIPVVSGQSKLSVNDSYLFCTYRPTDYDHVYIINPIQFSIYTDSKFAEEIKDHCSPVSS